MRFVWLALFLASTASAASFDCTNASAEVEVLICANPRLSALDDELAATWKAVAKTEGLRAEQREWLGTRDVCGDEECVEAEYLTRIATLRLRDPKRFAKQKVPARVVGKFAEPAEICMYGASGEIECEGEAENSFVVKRAKGNALTIDSELIFFNAHLCTIEASPAEWVGNELRVALSFGDDEPPECVLVARFDAEGVHLRDPENRCRNLTCGARAGFDGIALPKAKK